MQKIPTRLDLIKMLPSGAMVAEIGVRNGGFSNEILSHCPLARLYLIDPWKAYPEYQDPFTQEHHERCYIETQRMASNHSGRGVIIRDFSERVATENRDIPPLDAVYIDANHSYEAVTNDLIKWAARLKPDGVLLGHDYTDTDYAKSIGIEVIPAVTDFCRKHGWTLTHLTDEPFSSFRLVRNDVMNARIIHQIWLGGPMPDEVKELIQTIDDTNPYPRFTHKIWTEEAFAKEGIDIHQFDEQNDNVAGISGGLRLCLIYRFGGIYMDCDVECLKPLDELLQYPAFAAPQDHRLCNAIFGARAGHPWIKWQLENAKEIKGSDPTWSTILLDRAPRDGVYILPKETFYPWLWHVPETERRVTPETLAVHHWLGSWAKSA